ncbi:MAG: transcriptional repressor LexA [Candidatus Hydrogenedentes bacterium]|nr:transcriptional repressor LexA [Candidatus Hydrogenedentota bacterium]
MAKGLTKRQRNVLEFVIECVRDHGLPPTMSEICDEFGLTSTNAARDHLVALEKKGYLERSSKARGIRVTEQAAAGLYQHNIGALPLVGRVAAGPPLYAAENIEDYVPVASSLARRKAFCLRVNGDSMTEAGILDGDILVVDQQRRPRTGDIVVALIGDEATVKYFHPAGDQVELRPAHPTMQPLRYPAHDVQIQGVAVGLQRQLR